MPDVEVPHVVARAAKKQGQLVGMDVAAARGGPVEEKAQDRYLYRGFCLLLPSPFGGERLGVRGAVFSVILQQSQVLPCRFTVFVEGQCRLKSLERLLS